MYRSGNCTVTAGDYYHILSMYAITQHDQYGRPFVAEAHYPEENAWSAYTTNHSEHYDHSTFNDDIITGLLGLLPRSDDMLEIAPIIPSNWTYFALENVVYHNHLLTVLFDLTGYRYNQGQGLTVFVDGQKYHNTPNSSALVPLPDQATTIPSSTPVNIAINPKGQGYFPNATATSTYSLDSVFKAIDGFVFYDYIPDNRWTNNQSYYFNDTYTLIFARPRTFSSITLAIYSDRAEGGVVDCPAAIEVYGEEGLLANLSNFGEICLPNDRNTIPFAQPTNSVWVAINMFIKRGFAIGLAELEIWVPPNRGPMYYAVDAYLTNTIIEFDNNTLTATTTGAVVGNNSDTGSILFAGVYSETGGPVSLGVSYANRGLEAVTMTAQINRVSTGFNVTLVPTGTIYQTVFLDGTLLLGDNYVEITGGDPYVLFDTLNVQPK